jgi:hypothetical protein
MAIWILTLKTQETKTKWPSNWTFNIPLEISFQGLHFFLLKVVNQSLYVKNYEFVKLQGSSLLNNFWDSHLGILIFFAIWMYPSLLITKHIIGGEAMPPHKGLGHVNQMNFDCSWLNLNPLGSNFVSTNLLFGLCRFNLFVNMH